MSYNIDLMADSDFQGGDPPSVDMRVFAPSMLASGGAWSSLAVLLMQEEE